MRYRTRRRLALVPLLVAPVGLLVCAGGASVGHDGIAISGALAAMTGLLGSVFITVLMEVFDRV